MEPNRFGRVLGIGARVAGAKLREQADRLGAAAPPTEPAAGPVGVGGPARDIGASVGAGVRQAARNFRAAQASAGGAQAAGGVQGTSAAVSAGGRRLARGAGRFGAAVFRPFAHATSLLWNQIAGIFFALFALFFVEHTWMLYRAVQWRDRHVFLYGALGLVFLWFAASTLWRVRRR